MNSTPNIVIDTNVLVSAMRLRTGWSYELLSHLGGDLYQHVVTVPLVMEYEDVLMRSDMVRLESTAVANILDYLCATAIHQSVHFLWRPMLTDVKDDMVLEAAVNGQCQTIVTWNVRDLAAAKQFGIQVITPQTFLALHKGNAP